MPVGTGQGTTAVSGGGDTVSENTIRWVKPESDALAGSGLGSPSVNIYYAAVERTITGVSVIPNDALTAHNTNYAAFTMFTLGADGLPVDGTGIGAQLDTRTVGGGGSGNWPANTKIDFTLGADVVIPAGGKAALAVTKEAGGVITPGYLIQLQLAPL